MLPSIFKRVFAAVLAVLVFFTQAVGAHAAESNFWADRRRRVQEADNKPAPVLLASLPAGDPSQVLSSLPSVRSTSLDQLTPALAEQIQAQVPKSSVAEISSLIQALPMAYGQVRHLSYPSGHRPDKTVIHIQDVHLNLEAQKNIAASIQGLTDQGKVQLVALEGAFEPLDMARFQAYPDKDALKIVADDMLLKNEIPGPVYMAMTSGKAVPSFVGVDDREQHQRNVEAYRQSVHLAGPYKEKLAALQKENALQKSHVFNSTLIAFDNQVQAYRENRLPLGDYVKGLADAVPAIGDDTRHFLTALKAEKALDFSQVETERGRLIEALVGRLSKAQMEELLNHSVAYRLGQIGYGGFYRYLQDLCHRVGVDLFRYAALRSYMDYVFMADQVNAERLFLDVVRMEKEGFGHLAKTEDERRLIVEAKYLNYVGKLLDFALTPEEWRDYAATVQTNVGLTPFPHDLSVFEGFYHEAENRNHSMVKNLLSAMNQRAASTAVLVTGGFHTDGMEELLRQNGVACITVSPKITQVDTAQGSAYLTAFTREKTPLEKIFEGEKLFVAQKLEKGLLYLGVGAQAEAVSSLPPGQSFHLIDPEAEPQTESIIRKMVNGMKRAVIRFKSGRELIVDDRGNGSPRITEQERQIPLSVRLNPVSLLKENALFLLPILASLTAAVRNFDPQSLMNPPVLGHEISLLAVVGFLAGGINLAYHFIKKGRQQLRDLYGIDRTPGQYARRIVLGWGINAAAILPAYFAAFHFLQLWLHPTSPAILVLIGLAAALIAIVPVGLLSHGIIVNVMVSPDVPSMADLRGQNPLKGTGLVFGKFAPFHRGHEMLIRQALKESDRVILLLYDHPELTDIPAPEMAELIRKVIRDDRLEVRIVYGAPPAGDSVQARRAHMEFMRSQLPAGTVISKVFNNEWYGADIAEEFGAELIRVDPKRQTHNISATQIRNDPLAHVDQMHPLVAERVLQARVTPEPARVFTERLDTPFLDEEPPEAEKAVIKEKVLQANPGYDPQKLLHMMTWDVAEFDKPQLPAVIGELEDQASFSDRRGLRVLDMAIRMPGQGWAVPRELAPYAEAIRKAVEFERSINPDFDHYYVYVTVDQKEIEADKTQRRYGYHTDAYVTRETKEMNGNEVVADNTYVVYDDLATSFQPGPFPLHGIDPENCERVLQWFDQNSRGKPPVQYPPYTLLKLTPFDVHTPTRNKTGQTIERTFVKIQFSREKYNLIGNQVNPLLRYDGWTWVHRDPDVRNHRNILVTDWERKDKDDFLPVDLKAVDFSGNAADVPWAAREFAWAKKIEPVSAEPAVPGEMLETVGEGFRSTFNIAQRGDWKVTTSQGDQYFLSDRQFKSRYNSTPDEEGRYKPSGWPIKTLEITHPIRFRSPWGAIQYAPAGSRLAYLGGNDIYAILPGNFSASYRLTDELGEVREQRPAPAEQSSGIAPRAVTHVPEPGIREEDYTLVDSDDINFNRGNADLPWTDGRVIHAKKIEGVWARKARAGDVVRTMVDGDIVTTNIAKEGDWEVTTSQGDRYLLDDRKFKKRYNNELDGEGRYTPTGWPTKMVKVRRPVKLMAPWGAMQYLPAGSVIAYLEDGDVYGIHRDNFNVSYVETDPEGLIVAAHQAKWEFISGGGSSAGLLKALEANPDLDRLYAGDAGVNEGITLREHIRRVVRQFDAYFAQAEVNWPKEFGRAPFLLLLALHDIGKPQGHRTRQYENTSDVIHSLYDESALPLSKNQLDILSALVGPGPLGKYLRGELDAEKTIKAIREMAGGTVLPPDVFFKLLTMYYQLDTASYTRDAGGQEGLDFLFAHGRDRLIFDAARKRLSFAESYEKKFRRLEEAFSLSQPLDPSFVTRPPASSERDSLSAQLTSLNPRTPTQEVLSVPSWDIHEFDRPHLPVVVGPLDEREAFSRFEGDAGVRVLDLAIHVPGQGWAIPKALEPFKEAIRKAVEAERLVNPDFERRFVHITVDQKIVPPDAHGRRPGLHTDTSLRDDSGGQLDVTAENRAYIAKMRGKSDHAYVAHDVLPTEYYPGPFPLATGPPRSFEEMAEGQTPVVHPNYTLLRLNAYDVHTSVMNGTGHPVRRTFFKLQFTERLLDRDINTINPNFDYDQAKETSKIQDASTIGGGKTTLSTGMIVSKTDTRDPSTTFPIMETLPDLFGIVRQSGVNDQSVHKVLAKIRDQLQRKLGRDVPEIRSDVVPHQVIMMLPTGKPHTRMITFIHPVEKYIQILVSAENTREMSPEEFVLGFVHEAMSQLLVPPRIFDQPSEEFVRAVFQSRLLFLSEGLANFQTEIPFSKETLKDYADALRDGRFEEFIKNRGIQDDRMIRLIKADWYANPHPLGALLFDAFSRVNPQQMWEYGVSFIDRNLGGDYSTAKMKQMDFSRIMYQDYAALSGLLGETPYPSYVFFEQDKPAARPRNASDLALILAVPLILPWLASTLLPLLGFHAGHHALGLLSSLAAVLSAALVNEFGHMAEVGIRHHRFVFPRLGMGGVLGARFHVLGARGWSGMAANALALTGLTVAFALGHVAAPVAALGILANLIFAFGPTDVVDFVQQLRAPKPARDEAEFIVESAARVRDAYRQGALSKEEFATFVGGLLDRMPASMGIGFRQYAPSQGFSTPEDLGTALLNYAASPERLGSRDFTRSLNRSLRRRGVVGERSVRHFLSDSLNPSGTHVYFVDAQDLAANPAYWAQLVRSLDTYFSPRQYLIETPDDTVRRQIIGLGMRSSSVRLKPEAFGTEEAGHRTVLVRELQGESAGGRTLARAASVTFHATGRMTMDTTGLDARISQVLLDAANNVQRLLDALRDMPLSPLQLQTIDKVASAILAAA